MTETLGLANEVVVAGAGTGKTHALVTDYLFTLLGLDGSGRVRSPHRVLAITFTDKAAAEMRQRVAKRLGKLARTPGDDDDVAARAAERGAALPPPDVLDRLLRQLPGAPIATFHSVAAMLLRDYALAARVDPGFELLDDLDERQLVEETAEAVILDRLAEGDAEVAELAARFQLRRLGAGEGLVEGLASLLGSLAERGKTPADLDVGRPLAALDDELREARVELYEAMAALLVALDRGDAGRWAKERRVTLADRFDRLRQALDAAPDDAWETRVASAFRRVAQEDGGWGSGALLDARLRAFGALQAVGSVLCDRAVVGHASALRSLLIDLEGRVGREKEARGVLGFGDLLLRARGLLRDDPELRVRVKARFDRILVDEYQDTSPVQEDLVALLAEEPQRKDRVDPREPAMGVLRLGRGRLFVVGDPKQSIYGFRGADASLFDHTLHVVTEGTEALPSTGARRWLNHSWRSRRPIVDLVNAVAAVTLPDNDDGVTFDEGDRLSAERPGQGPAGALLRPDLRGVDPDDAEPWVIARKVRALLDDGVGVGDDDWPCRPRDITVLVRRIKAAGPIARALAHVGVPAHITGGEGFFSRPEVMDLVAALRLLVEPADDLAAITVLRSPLVGFPDADLVRLHAAFVDVKRPLGLAAALEATESLARAALSADGAAPLDALAAGRLVSLCALLDELRGRVAREPLPRLLDELVDRTGLVLALGVEPDAADRLANVEKLRVLCEGRPGEGVPTVGRLWDFLDRPPREGVATAVGPEVDAVRIMTVHQAKGLEFPIVFVADLGAKLPGAFADLAWDPAEGLAVSYRGRPIAACETKGASLRPTALQRVRQRKEGRDEAELARLLYVALTRARDHVFLVGEEESQGNASLRRLVERARTSNGRRFDELLPIERLPGDAPPARELPEEEVPPEHGQALPPPRSPIRVGPSALGREGDEPPDDDEPEAVEERRRRGRLAHTVIARAGQEADGAFLDDEEHLRVLVEACLRAEGEDPRSTRFSDVVRRCVATLGGPVRALVQRGYQLSFEEALAFETTTPRGETVVLAGTADLIARRAGRTLVVDFKSSRTGAVDARTWLQLSAYAAALEGRGEAPVEMAAWVVGATPDPDDGRPYDSAADEALHAAVAASAAGSWEAGEGRSSGTAQAGRSDG